MKAPEHFEVMEESCCYRLTGHGSLAEAGSKVVDAITFAREQGVRKLLVDTTKWTGHGNPNAFERYHWAAAFTEAAGRAVKLSMVIRPEMMDPDKFEVVVAANRGLIGNVFDSEKDAVVWLLDSNAR